MNPGKLEAPLRRIRFRDPESGNRLVILTNHFALPALTINWISYLPSRHASQVSLFLPTS